MLLSAELRWFWPDVEPLSVRDWFMRGSIRPGGGVRTRHDDYYILTAGQTALGIKRRDVRNAMQTIEVKSLVAKLRAIDVVPFAGEPAIWIKFQADANGLAERPAVRIGKRRWLRKFSAESATLRELALDQDEKPEDAGGLPPDGCNVEFTELEVSEYAARYWTLGFEAFGAVNDIEKTLKRTLEHTASQRAPILAGAFAASYPELLSRLLEP